jgi:ACS family tartrate transporter-like MFS transporter
LSLNGTGGLAGWQWLFLLEGLPAIVLGIVVLFYMTERPEHARWLSDTERLALTEALRRDANESPAIAATVRAALASGRIWLLAIVYFTIPIALYAFGVWLPQIIRASSNGSDFQIGLLTAIPYLVGAAGMVLAARHSDRSGERRWHIAGAALMGGAAFVVSAFVQTLGGSLVALSVAMLGLASMFGPFWAFATAGLRGVGAAAAIALINSIGNTGGFVGPYAIGYIRERTQSFTGGLVFVGVVLALMPLLVFTLSDDSP